MRKVIGVFGLALLVLAGCSKASQPQENQESLNRENLTVVQADALLAKPVVNTAAQALTAPSSANIVVNEAAEPLMTSESAAATSMVSSETPDARNIQTALKALGLYQGEIDGALGPKSKEAIREFQRQNNLSVDGKVGPKTWALLKKGLSENTTVSSEATGIQN